MKDVMYDDLQAFRTQSRPKKVKGQFNATTFFWKRYLSRMIFGSFDFENMPEGWDRDYILTSLFYGGFFTICDTAMGVLPLRCGVSGYNVFEHPTEVQVANPVLGNFSKTIDVDCALVKLQYNYLGVVDVLNHYAELLAECDASIAVNLMNSRVAAVFFADTETQAKTMRKMYDTITAGEPAVFVKRSQVQKSDIYFNKVKENFIVDDIQIVQRKIIDQFLTSVGINNANTDKKERMIRAEAESNNAEVETSVEHWLVTVNEGLDVANRLFGLNLKFVRKEFEEPVLELDEGRESEGNA